MWLIASILIGIGVFLLFGGAVLPGIVMLGIGGFLFWQTSATRQYLNNNKK